MMALSNIFREPRREITESVVGIGVVVTLFVPDYFFADWLHAHLLDRDGEGLPYFLGMPFGVAVLAACGIIIFVTHEIGEGICNLLQRHGRDPRPRQRR